MRCLMLVPLLAVSCIVPAPSGESGAAPQKVPMAPQAPVEVRNGANFDDKVELVGATINPGRVMPGDALHVTLFFKVTAEIPNDYTIFVHIEDVEGRVDRLNADHMPVQGTYPTSKWKIGETVKDEFTIYVPPQMPVRGLNILMGLWDAKTDTRMKIKNPDAVRNDGNGRVLLAQIPVGAS